MAYSSKPKIAEDDPRWNPRTMGNKRSKPKVKFRPVTPDQFDRNRGAIGRHAPTPNYRSKSRQVKPVWHGKKPPGGAIPNAPVRKAPSRYA